MNALDLRTFDDAEYSVELIPPSLQVLIFFKTSILLLSSQVLKEAIIFILQGKKSFDTTELAWAGILIRVLHCVSLWQQTHHFIVLARSLRLQNSLWTENVPRVLHRNFFTTIQWQLSTLCLTVFIRISA